MTIEAIQDRARREAIKHETAAAIRKLLDEAAEKYGDEWSDDEAENSIIEMVVED